MKPIYININEIIGFIQQNWLTIVLVLTALVIVLKAVAKLRIRWAKITPDTADDEEARIFSKKIDAIIQFFKDIIPGLNKKDKTGKGQGGFAQVGLQFVLVAFIVGLLAGAGLLYKFRKADVKEVRVPEYIEVQKLVVDKGEKKSNVQVIKEYDCPGGQLSKETMTESTEEKKNLAHKEDRAEESPKLDLLLGGGGQILTGDKLRSIDKVTPQAAGGITYKDYGGFLASDFDKSHAAYVFRKFSF